MDQSSFEARIRTLKTKRPIRLIYLPNKLKYIDGHFYDNHTKDCGSLAWLNEEGKWEHIITVPRGRLYTYKHDDYCCQDYGGVHNSLDVVYRRLVARRLVQKDIAYNYLMR